MRVQNLSLRPSPCSRLPHTVPRARPGAPAPRLSPLFHGFLPCLCPLLHSNSCFWASTASCSPSCLNCRYTVPNFTSRHCSGSLTGLCHLILTTALGHRYRIHAGFTKDTRETMDLQGRWLPCPQSHTGEREEWGCEPWQSGCLAGPLCSRSMRRPLPAPQWFGKRPRGGTGTPMEAFLTAYP